MSTDHVLFEQRGPLAVITLNRPDRLNALSLDMIKAIAGRLTAWESDPLVRAVAVRSDGPAFCAGGDVTALCEMAQRSVDEALEFLTHMYRLQAMVKNYSKPYIAFVGGYAMGGGMALAVNGRYTVGVEGARFSMPETALGIIPDVGASYFLGRMPGKMGVYLGLTGARINAAGALFFYASDYYFPTGREERALAELAAADYADAPDEAVCEILALGGLTAPPTLYNEYAAQIEEAFSADSVAEVLARLKNGSAWAQDQAQIIENKAPFATCLTFEMFRRAQGAAFEECLQLEHKLMKAAMRTADFREGVRAVLIDKDQAPKWEDAHASDVDPARVAAAFVQQTGLSL